MGYEAVVLDRSWLSEPIYGRVMREGKNRIGGVYHRMLERMALRAGSVVVHCCPPWQNVEQSFKARHAQEYAETIVQIGAIYDAYVDLHRVTALPVIHYDYTQDTMKNTHLQIMAHRPGLHLTEYESVGRWDAPLVLLGDRFAQHKDKDSWHQWPFVSWTTEGCSQWFTAQLDAEGISEYHILWLNVASDAGPADLNDFLHAGSRFFREPVVVALGEPAHLAAYEQHVPHITIEHPMYWKRFRFREPYAALHKVLEQVRI